MHVVERLFCTLIWLGWRALMAGGPDHRPTMPGSSGEASRRLLPDRTVLPGW